MTRQTLVCLAVLLCAVSAIGQDLDSAVLSGDVIDPSGAAVMGAEVAAQSKATSVLHSAITNGTGLFVLNGLAPGDYEVRVVSKGFGPTIVQVRLEVGQQQELKVHLRLQAAQTTINIDDTGAAPLVNTAASVVDGVITSQQIDSLPLNGRNFLELSLLIPGNAPAPNFDPTKSDTVVISTDGQLGRGGNVSIDGADNNDDTVGGMLHNVPEDAVQEFQIATNQYSAALGRSGSSVVNVVTKSGTNVYHGTAAIFARDQSLQAKSPLVDPSLGTPPFRREQYAGSVGGPVIKDKAWFYSAFEYRDQVGGVEVGTPDLNTDTIIKSFASAPVTDVMGTVKGDWQMSNKDALSMRYSIERLNATGASTLDRALGSASQRQVLENNFQAFVASWTRVITPNLLNRFSFAENNFINITNPVVSSPQIDLPSLQEGASFRVPQQTKQNRLQFTNVLNWAHGKHNFKFGAEVQHVAADFYLGVFQQGRIEAVENFPDFDRNGDGVVNYDDLLFAATLRSAYPDRPLVLPNDDNNYVAFFAQDEWRVAPQLTLNLGLRYELDTNVKDISYYSQINPIVQPFLHGTRGKDINNFGPRIGFNWANPAGNLSVHGGYGIYYDRITLEIMSLERGLNGTSLPIEVRAGNAVSGPNGPVYLDANGFFLPGAPTLANPFTGFIFPGAGAAGINIIDNAMQNPEVQQFNLGFQWEFTKNWVVRADGIHDLGTHFILGVPIGTVYNPVVGGPDVVKNLESSVNTHYDALFLTVDHRFSNHYQFHAAYTLSKSSNYANDDQIPFGNGPIDPLDLHREYGPTPNDQRNRLVLSGTVALKYGFQLSPLWTIASSVPMDIMLPDNSTRIPQLGRNAGCRQFSNGAQLNAFLTQLNANGGEAGMPLPLVDPNVSFCNNFNSFDLRLSKQFNLDERMSLQLIGEVFNLFNTTNILGVSNTNYSGYANVLVRDSDVPTDPGYLHSSTFGQPVTTAGGVFGSGGPRAFQLALRFSF
jgi:Carboxypeptidase regulatory-like domain/TonB dependent receptor